MKHRKIKLAGLAVAASVLGIGAMAWADNGGGRVNERLEGYQEVPALSTSGTGEFTASISKDGSSIAWTLTFGGLETDATQAHIHFENATNNGPVVVFLCSNLAGAPAGTQACPAGGGTISGTIHAADVGAGAAGQGLAAGELAEFIAALRSGATYVNVHSVNRPGGEIRAQIDDHGRGHDD